MENKKIEVLAILLLISALTMAYSAFMPEIPLNSKQDVSIRFISFDKLFDFSSRSHNELADSLLATYMTVEDSLHEIKIAELDSLGNMLDSLIASRDTNFFNPVDSNGHWHLDAFFDALQDTNALIHVAHYGASEAEGDRITSNLRKKFQTQFGGIGQGYIPMQEEIWNVSCVHESSANWQEYTVFHNRHNNRFYGASGKVFRFGKYSMHKREVDSTETTEGTGLEAMQETSKSALANDSLQSASDSIPIAPVSASVEPKEDSVYYVYHDNASIHLKLYAGYNNMYVMYGNAQEACKMTVLNKNRDTLLKDILPVSQNYTKHRIAMSPAVTDFTIEFVADKSPDFYGLMAEGSRGIQVDNYAIRGHSGDGLLLINDAYLQKQLSLLNTKLIILQFGANAVPYIKTEKERQYIEDLYYDLLMKFRKAAPQASIIFLGVGDMATRIDGQYLSYPSIPQMIDAQIKAAERAGVVFWNWYNVMGGANSIFAWSKQGMAVKDGHLAEKGQEVFAQQFFAAIMREYKLYLFRKQKEESEKKLLTEIN